MKRRYTQALLVFVIFLVPVALLHLYASLETGNALNRMGEQIGLGEFRSAGGLPPGNPEYFDYVLSIVFENPTDVEITVAVRGIELAFDDIQLGSILINDETTVEPRGEGELAGQLRITKSTLDKLRSRGEVEMTLVLWQVNYVT
jgi:hypothetical protein